LEKAFECINAWGFTFKTIGFVWVKQNKKTTNTLFWGQGYYTRQNVELCLIATKGKPLPRQSKGVHQVIQLPVEDHSKKPQEFRDRINQMYGNVNVVELFARPNFNNKYDWTLVGNEITGNDITVDIENLKNL
jgi:N6-adenosine-specific RNA methylase IME4